MQLSDWIGEKSERKKRYCGSPDRVLRQSNRRDPVQGGTGAKRGKPRACHCGQGGAGDGRWSPISVQAVERSSLGSGVAAAGILRRKTQRSGPAGLECQLFDAGVVFRLSEDGSIG